jgi:hypothetical protein
MDMKEKIAAKTSLAIFPAGMLRGLGVRSLSKIISHPPRPRGR